MTYRPLQKPSEMPPERRRYCRACYEIQDLYWQREETQDPKELAEIDRQLVEFLLKLAQSDELFSQLGLTAMEVRRLKKHRRITETVRDKLRIYASGFTYRVNGS